MCPDEAFQARGQALQAAAESAGTPMPEIPEIRETAATVFAWSRFVYENCRRSPLLLPDLAVSGDLLRPYPEGGYRQKLESWTQAVTDESRMASRLRRFRNREMVRIAWRDLCRWADLQETMAELTALAEALIDRAVEFLHGRLVDRYGTPTASGGAEQQLVVIGMGKLGGGELNFSSDIDLIFAYPERGQTCDAADPVSNDEFFNRLCRNLLQLFGKTTPDGFVYRVDMRLRPFGENGPLVMNFDAMEQYYHYQGREWERYAWIKAREVGGDRRAGRILLERLNPFVYRRYLDFGAFESLREMKRKIELEVRRKGLQDDIKIGRGGIREIEFFGQVFQLIRGGVSPVLQQQGIETVLPEIAREKLVPEAVCGELQDAYRFLRRLEHRLQEYDDQQTHRLPSDATMRKRLAQSMDFVDESEFTEALKAHRERVHHHFSMLLGAGALEVSTHPHLQTLAAVWRQEIEPDRMQAALHAAGFEPAAEALRLLLHLRGSVKRGALGREGRRRLDRLMPQVLQSAGRSDTPLDTLERIVELIEAIGGRAAYLALLVEYPDSLDHLVRLMEASPWIARFLTRHPVLLDELLDSRTLYAPPGRPELERELSQRFEALPDDLETRMDALRVFKQVNVLRVAAADVTEVLPLMRVSDRLSDIAEVVLEQALEMAWRHLVAKHGKPRCNIGSLCLDRGFAVIAYGKLGGLELGYGSDLDLVFIHAAAAGETAAAQNTLDNRQFFARLGQRVIHILTAHTRAGILYEADMRLRPSGSSGILVSHIDGFREYQQKSAWSWEHQALIRARPVGGDRRLQDQFRSVRSEILSASRDPHQLRRDVLDMRSRMRHELLKNDAQFFDIKQGHGGIVDIEFLVQYLVLAHAHRNPALLQWTDNVRLIQTLMETGIMDEIDAHILKHAYLVYRAVSHKRSLQEQPARVAADRFALLRRRVSEIWDHYMEIGP
ncbi:MAG TPA: bifunctional [glutamate--ammonia ligase]-adenylyl-L-tyrosine phosphorylase/[glutamate--ammonia-ligase] adenylyltransferase [Desulfobacterales bacterium]